MPTIRAEQLSDLMQAIFEAAGTPSDIAEYVTRTLVTANLMGHDSHGVIRARGYLRGIREGSLHPAARPEIEQQEGAVALIDCQRGFGQIGAHFGAEVAADLAREFGIGCTALKEANHIGRVGEYADWLAREKLIGILMVGAPWMTTTPFGGREGIFGTNPMAWGVPTSDEPLVLDFATSAVAAGKLMVARDADKPVPQGWVLDKEGRPTTNPNDLFDGGMLLPFGTYKGFGLNLMMEIIPVLLTGYASAFSEEFIPGNATVMIALSIEAFTSYERFIRLTDELKQRVKQVPTAPGFNEVLLPGELEARSQAVRQREGIPLADQTWTHLLDEAAAWGVVPPPLT